MSDYDIHGYCQLGHSPLVTLLLARGSYQNKTNDDGDTPLHYASRGLQLDIVNILLGAGAEVNKTNNNGASPLHCASGNNCSCMPTSAIPLKSRDTTMQQLQIVDVLIAAGVDVNKTTNDGDTPLHYASTRGHFEVVISLIRANADVHIMNHNEELPVDEAGNDEIRQYIHQRHRWQRRRPLILTRPHDDHESNKAHKLKALGNIVTATSSGNEPSSHDDILFQIKLKVASFL